MHDSSIFNIRIDFEKSHDSYIFDKNTQSAFLDFFGLYSSLPLGYSHPIFKTEEFKREYMRIAGVKVPNCEIISDEAQEFLHEFSTHPSMAPFKHFHFCCTGALGIEAAIKTAIDQKGSSKPHVLSFLESFHGINGYGGFATDRFVPVRTRLEGLPDIGWTKLETPKIHYKNNAVDEGATRIAFDRFLKSFDEALGRCGASNIAALIVEPIQATYGDSYYPKDFFKTVRRLCDEHQICLIFDEIQTGVGTTGTMWHFEQTGIVPDVVVFGKKLQVAGIMVSPCFNKIFQTPVRLEVTWDGSLCDMVRGKYVLRAYKQYNLIANAKERGLQILEGLRNIPGLLNPRGCGMFAAFDFPDQKSRDAFFTKARGLKFMCNKTRDITVRLRPNMNVSQAEVNEALRLIKISCDKTTLGKDNGIT